MALWGKTDASGSAPKFIDLNNYPAGTQLIFVDATEVGLDANKKKGLTNAGWWLFREYNDNNGDVRRWAECLVAMSIAAADSGDQADDVTAADVNAAITISGQPTNQTASAGAATFTVTATVAPSGTVTYQWQVAAAGTNRFSNISGATSASLALTGLVAGDNGKKYRVQLTSTSGAPKVTSDAATLTVA